MRPQLTDRKPLAVLNRSLVVTAVLAALLMAASFWLGARNKSDDEWVLHSLAVREQLTQVRILVQAAETGQRGYLITGRDAYLAPYDNAVAAFPETLDSLEKLVSDNPAHEQSIAALRQLIKDKLDELRSTIDEAKAGHADAARAIVNNDSGFRLMQQINQRLAAMDAEEDRLLNSRQAAAARSGKLLQAGVALAFVLICILGALMARFTRQSFAALTTARDQLLASNNQLLEQITRREQAESQLRQSQKMEALGQLTGGIAHDFNNMLGVIMGAHDLMSRRIKNGDFGIQRFLDAATNATERAAVLTQRLLAFARQQPLAPQPIDANKMIGNMSDLLHSTLGEHIQIETVTAGGLWMVHADLQQLESAVLNIAINARDAMPDGGKLTIETANAYLDAAYCRENPEIEPGQFVMTAISDTGNGMAPEVAARVFDPFFTTKPTGKGTGLGMSQVYGFVKQSRGHIKIYSEPGAGTTVKIYLPRLIGDAKDIKRETAAPVRTGDRSEIILVVEDDASMRRLATDTLHELGYTAFEADNAANALAILDREEDVKLLFTDVVMPDTNGKKLADEALRRRPRLKVLFTTGYTTNAVVHGGVLDPGVQLISKPYTLDQLAAKVRAVLDET
ncbi:MAG TPA: CHASE3 domain-containing protein [Xanthobacteraceae bacterium]|nr:CHASE3 domain-containing protein [Xanthobacteraceae bacterium]